MAQDKEHIGTSYLLNSFIRIERIEFLGSRLYNFQVKNN